MAFERKDYAHSEPPAETTWHKAGCDNAKEYRGYLNWSFWREFDPFMETFNKENYD